MICCPDGERSLGGRFLGFPHPTADDRGFIGHRGGGQRHIIRSLGEKDTKRAHQVSNNGLFLAFFSALLFVVFGLFFPLALLAR